MLYFPLLKLFYFVHIFTNTHQGKERMKNEQCIHSFSNPVNILLVLNNFQKVPGKYTGLSLSSNRWLYTSPIQYQVTLSGETNDSKGCGDYTIVLVLDAGTSK